MTALLESIQHLLGEAPQFISQLDTLGRVIEAIDAQSTDGHVEPAVNQFFPRGPGCHPQLTQSTLGLVHHGDACVEGVGLEGGALEHGYFGGGQARCDSAGMAGDELDALSLVGGRAMCGRGRDMMSKGRGVDKIGEFGLSGNR